MQKKQRKLKMEKHLNEILRFKGMRMSTAMIARYYGVHRHTITKILNRHMEQKTKKKYWVLKNSKGEFYTEKFMRTDFTRRKKFAEIYESITDAKIISDKRIPTSPTRILEVIPLKNKKRKKNEK